ncbi:mechanosensitive ion channel family protein [Sphingobacterium griseoflavum]|uniref:Mechanosensitive ion channel protein MscS n=1 Tax=Sphingobacterium griseoflavum TaxID=1474952 RepID=A0ABQ3HQI8_9SPHI|nr:mechanosensitive ion channel domain-containing protein [Sphingobacterium griseoflavum]GHE23481.1 mechanosensitive ion channel protein MscS [Sphingobacterium griseoflavum]
MKNTNFIDISTLQKSFIYDWTYSMMVSIGLPEQVGHLMTSISLLIATLIVLLLTDFIVRKIFKSLFVKLIHKTSATWDDKLLENNVLNHLSHLVPVFLAQQLLPAIFVGFPTFTAALIKFLSILMIILVFQLFGALLKTTRDILRTSKVFVDKPLDSYLQVAQIILLFICGTIIFSVVTGNSPWSFLVSLGAASAILMLVFKDTILGFVASIQVSANDSVRVGDWVEMAKYGADGDVIQINLNNVKVQNFDKTIVSIPTHTLLTDSFKNYRGMRQFGGRRIKRAINIKISSIRYLDEDEIRSLSRIHLLAPYIKERQEEIAQYNIDVQADASMPINGRRMTNIGLFREYIERYAQNNPSIHQDRMLMIRQLAPTEHGLPLELYMFAASTEWTFYENTMANIFDHLFAAIKYFDLEVFELPASDDLREMLHNDSRHSALA